MVIERDNNQGTGAAFKKIFKVDFSQVNAQGFVPKEEVANLLDIQDPNDLNSDGNKTYNMPFQTIEDVVVWDNKTIIVANDNNYPFSIGRPPLIDNNEIVVLELDKPLALDARLGLAATIAESSQLVFGTPGVDNVSVPQGTDGINDIIFTGAGDDKVDTLGVTNPYAGNNTVHSGSGKDIIDVNNGDRIFGGSGNDEIFATDAKDYRISGGSGNDVFYLGTNGRALGGDGEDKFFVTEGGGNLISGGAGADQFWITTGNIPSVDNKNVANTIVDFQIGTDVLGISGQGSNFGFNNLTLTNSDIIINGNKVATLTGINTSTLTASNFAFA
ncbi:esterase-like activity of phytase family protein [Cylindrospermopsis raciborskii]|uniref:esterase-like activity of phytase family protein n=1 Tax=Cylindrospermopsis raciborskii TaxID=77022 RepID=UPI003BF7FD9F